MPKQLSPVPVRTPLAGQGGTPTSPWTRFFGDLLQAASTMPSDVPAASTTASDLSVPIVLQGKTYYLRLSSTP